MKCPNCSKELQFIEKSEVGACIYVCNNESCSTSFVHMYPENYDEIIIDEDKMDWIDPAGGIHSHDDDDPSSMYQ